MERVYMNMGIDKPMYDSLIHIANQLDISAYDLVRSLIEYTVKEYADK